MQHSFLTSEAFSLTETIWFHLNSSWITVYDRKSRSQEKHVKLSSKLNSVLSHKMSSLFQYSLYHFQASKVISTCRALSFFRFSRKVTSKNLLLVSCFVKTNFCWRSAEIWLESAVHEYRRFSYAGNWELVKSIVGTKFRRRHVCLHSQAGIKLWQIIALLFFIMLR